MKPIRFSRHASERLGVRGATEGEVIETIRTISWALVGTKHFECQKDFPYGTDWNGKFYATKRVRPIFAEEDNEIVVVIVYVYFF